MELIIAIGIAAILALIPANIASKKGKSFGTWYVYGVLLWIIALIHSIILEDESKSILSQKKVEKLVQQNYVLADMIDINSNVSFTNYTINRIDDNELVLSGTILNEAEKSIKAIKFMAKAFNSFEELILIDDNSEFEILVQDLNLAMDNSVLIERIAVLKNNDIRSLSFRVVQIAFTDGSYLNVEKEPYMVKSCQEPIQEKYQNIIDQTNSKIKYYMIQDEHYWQCTCGYVNKPRRNKCYYCGQLKDEAGKFSKDNIDKTCRKLSEEKEIEKKKQRRATSIAICVVAILTIICGALMYHNNQVKVREYAESSAGVYSRSWNDYDGNRQITTITINEDGSTEMQSEDWKGKITKINSDDTFTIRWYTNGGTREDKYEMKSNTKLYQLVEKNNKYSKSLIFEKK